MAQVESNRKQEGTYIHASCVILGEAGILIRGASGSGKTTLACALIDRAQREGCFARFIGDDRISLSKWNGRLLATGHPAIQGKIEARSFGIRSVPFGEAAVLKLLVDLTIDPARFQENGENYILLEGVKLRRCALRQAAAFSDLAFSLWTDLKSKREI